MRALLVLIGLLPLLAQQPTAPVTTPAPTPAPAPTPTPAAESALTGSIDLGYRWVTNVSGSVDTYRSIVNLGSGPKFLAADFTLTDPKKRLFDRLHIRASGWGGDPYSVAHVDGAKSGLYDFTVDYRDIAYFNFLPSYADPLLTRGITLNEQSFDTRRRFGGFSLNLLPGNWFIPYLAFDRDSESGTGASVFVTDGNEYPVPNQLRDATNLFRGGVRFELRRFHATIEEGGTTFKSDQSLFDGSQNTGNVLAPVLGQTLSLSSLTAAYGITGHSIYSKALFTANPASWLDVYGQFLYSQPETSVHYQQYDTGNLYLQSQALFYASQQYLVSAASKLPHTGGSLGAEIRPLRRVRIFEVFTTDRLHNSGSSASNQTVASPALSQQIAALLASSLVTNYSQDEVNVFFDVTSKLTIRGGYRYVWGDASDAILPAAGLVSADQGKLRRNVGLGGATFHPTSKISLTADVEAASSGGAYFRTSLYNYQKVRGQGRYQVTGTLNLSADFTVLNNQNPTPGIHYDYLAHQESIALLWSPKAKVWDFQGSYSRSALRSDIGYLEPQDLTAQTSLYRENTHTVTALFHLKLPHAPRFEPDLTAGGSFFRSSGSRPSSYYQPVAKLQAPLRKNASLFAEWRYYGYGEAFYLYEGFRANLVTAGVRFTR